MRKSVIVAQGNWRKFVCFCVLNFFSANVYPQGANVAPMPKDPHQLLLLAQKQNRLSNPDMRPWHLRISIKQFDPSGGMTAESQIEEFWASESKHKMIYTTPTASMTEFTTERGLFRSGVAQTSFGPMMLAAKSFTNPIFENENLIEKWILDREKRDENGLKLVCVNVKGINIGSEKREFAGLAYCLDSSQPALLSKTTPYGTTAKAVYTRKNIQDFHGYYVPQDVELTVGGTRLLEAHLDLIEDLPQADDSLFSPPPDAALAPVVKAIYLSASVASAHLQHASQPDYPIAAKAAGISGTVVVEAKISKDGSVSDVTVVSGPKELQQAAMDAVRTWKYKPYVLNGEVVEVRTNVNVLFQLHP